MKIGEYQQMMSHLTRPFQPKTQVADLVDEMSPGPLKDELQDKFDPDQETYEEYLQRRSLGERPFNAASGGRANFSDGTEEIAEPPKSMKVDTTTKNPIPDYDITDFRNDAELYVLMLHNNTIPMADIASKLNSFAQKGIDAGTFTMQEAADTVKDLKLYIKDRARYQRLRDIIPSGIGTIKREEFAPGGRPRADVPGLEEEVKKLFNQGLSTNQVLKNLKEKPEFEKVSEGVVKRIKKEFNLGAKSADLLKSQADKYNKLKELIEQSNNQLKFVDLRTLRERVGLPRKAAPTDKANMEKFNVPKLDSAQDKVRKGFQKIISNPNVPAEEVFDISTKIGKDTNLSPASVSQFLQNIPEYQDFKPAALKLQSPAFKAGVVKKGGVTLADVIDMAENPRTSSGYTSVANTPERFILNSVIRHIDKGGDKVEWVVPPSDEVRDVNAVFKYKGKEYDYYDLKREGRKIDDFKEVYDMYEQREKLLAREVTDPTTKQKTTFKKLMQKAYAEGGNFSPYTSPYEIDHFSSVKDKPFSNLRILPKRINALEGTLKNKALQAETGFLTPEKIKMYTPEKIKDYLKAAGYSYTKNPDKLFKDEVKLANDILVKSRKLKTPTQVGKLKTGVSLGAMGDIPMAKEILKKDFEKLKTIFGSKAAKQIASSAITVPGLSALFELPFISEYQELGYSPKEIATQLLTGGMGVPFKDIQERGKFVEEKGLGETLQSALRKQMIPQSIRPAMNLPADFGAPQELTPSEKQALEIFGGEAQDVIDARRKIQADEYKRLQEMTDFDDPMFRVGAMGGGIMRLGFADGPKDPSKRKFMKIMGGLASLPILGKFIKPAAKVAPVVVEAAKGMPEWFGSLISKVIKEGTDVTKQFGKKGEQVFVKQLGEAEGVKVTKNLETGKIKVDYESPTNMGEQSVSFTYRPGTKTEKGENLPAQFEAVEAEPKGIRSGPDDYDIEFDGENIVEDAGELMSDTSSLKQFATGKLDDADLKLRQQKVKKVEAINNDQMEQAEYLETKYGAGDPDAYKQFPDDDL